MGIIIGGAALIALIIGLHHLDVLRESRNHLRAIHRILDERLPKP